MLRRIRITTLAALAAIALAATACSDLTAPSADCSGHQTSDTCPE